MKKNKHISMAEKSKQIREEIAEFLKQNEFTEGDLSLSLTFNPWYETNKNPPYTYYLKKGSSQSVSYSFEELNALKKFLNSVTLIQT